MAHYAKVENKIVTEVIVAEQEFINALDDASLWVQTSYNTRHNQHDLGNTPLRYNFAGIGFNYEPTADAFYPPQPYPSWTLDTEIYDWVAPVEFPDDDNDYDWNEETQNWTIRGIE